MTLIDADPVDNPLYILIMGCVIGILVWVSAKVIRWINSEKG